MKTTIVLITVLTAVTVTAVLMQPTPLQAQKNEWIKVTLTDNIPESKSVDEVKKELLGFARRKAIEQKTGVLFQSTQISNTFSAKERESEEIFDTFRQLTKASVGGKIVDEKDPAYQQTPNDQLTIRYQAKIEEERVKPDPTFTLECQTNRSVYQLGEDLSITVEPAEDAYITIFSITQNDRVSVLFPNYYMKNQFVEAHETREIPNSKEAKILTFTLQKPQSGGLPYAELLMCMATKKPVSFDRLKSDTEYSTSWLEVNRWLMNIPADMRTEQYVQYQVVDK